MKIFLLLFVIVFGFFGAAAQAERYVKPVDEAGKDASFLAFRTRLIEAVKRRDARYVLSVLDRKIANSFDDDSGIEEFREQWKIDRSDSQFWDAFVPVITNGGVFVDEDGKVFMAPYSFRMFPDDLDAFDYSVIFGSNVNLRSAADANSPVVASLSYNIVQIVESVIAKEDAKKIGWYQVKTLGGHSGFVKEEFVRSAIDYRAGFKKKNGKWKMIFFLAGD